MALSISAVTIVVPDYDDAIGFYVGVLGFELIEDTYISAQKRLVQVSPPGAAGTRLLLARAAGDEQVKAIGNQTGGRVFLFLSTDDFNRDHCAMTDRGVEFLEQPRHEPYGIVAVFRDPFGNKWDLIQPVGK